MQGGEPPKPPPAIRQDLNLYPAGEDDTGAPIWHLHDPAANLFYRLDEHTVELLALIGHRSAAEISEAANRFIRHQTTDEEVEELLEFLRFNNLVVADDLQVGHFRERVEQAPIKKWYEMAMNNPLFFRAPLFNPDRFLETTLPYVRWLTSIPAKIVFLFMGIMGMYSFLQQIDQFFATFMYFFSWAGMVIYFVVLFGVKILHELGHAYTAKMMGCRVPVIGVAVMVGYPIFYTDTSDAWKIQEKSRRLKIGAAGISVELAIALISLFLWSITPDGAMRSAFFLLATTTWVLSLSVNLNPLMKFDGYYLFSDLIETPNLEKRSFEMAKWWLREKIFGFGESPAEEPRRFMVVFAFSVWTYRLLLFLGIAMLVYGLLFKALGIAMMVYQLSFMVGRPVSRELKEWWKRREMIRWNRQTKRVATIFAVIALLLFIPWYSAVTAPAVMQAKTNDLYLPVAGKLVSRLPNGPVNNADLLFEFESPQLTLQIAAAQNRYEELSWIRSAQGFDQELRSESLIVESELRTQNQLLRSLVNRQEQLRVAAGFSGVLTDVPSELRPGNWFPNGFKLGSLIDPAETKVVAYLRESELGRVESGMSATFYPENPEFSVIELVVDKIEFMGSPELDNLYVASTFGGSVAVRKSKEGELITVQSHYRLELRPLDESLVVDQIVRGEVVIDGHSESLFSRIRKRFIQVFIRETGF